MDYLNINALDIDNEVRLIFEANLDVSKGKSNKTYSITIPDTSYNNTALDNLFGKYIGRTVSFAAQYTVEGVVLTGVLLITEVGDHEAKGTFITGNGVVWQAMSTDTLQDVDFSEYDIVLNKTNVLASESGYPMVVFDLTDRGAFKGGSSAIDITDRYPAFNVKQLLIELFNAYGFYLDVEDNTGYFEQLYLLFSGSNEIRNSADWLQDAAASAGGYGQNYEDTGTGTAFQVNEKLLFPTDEKDPGGNLTASVYTAPETGTYQFIVDYNLRFQRPTLATVANEAATLYFKKNGSTLHYTTLPVDLSTEIYNEFTGIFDSKPIELTTGDTVEVWIDFTGDITYSGTWTMDVTQGIGMKLTVVPSRWYGAGSTVEINSVLPSMKVSDFIKQTLTLLNADVYFNENENAVKLVVGRTQREPVAAVECYNYSETLDDKASVVLQYATDKARPQADQLIKIIGAKQTVTTEINYSRTLVAPCYRLFSETATAIPVMWQAGDPLDFEQASTPPEQKTASNLRILRKATAATGAYYLSYGGVSASNQEAQTSILQMVEPDIRSLHIYDSSIERKLIQCDAKLDVSKLYDNTYFDNDITLKDRRTGNVLLIGRLKKAEQLRGNNYRLTLYPTAQEQIDGTATEWFTPAETVNTTSQSGGSTGSGTSTYVPPADMWQSSVAGQIEGLTAKATLVDADDFVIDDSAASNAKKKFSWSAMKTNLSSFFYGAFTGQFNGTTAKTSLDNNDVFVIEDSAATPTAYIKKSIKWSSIRTILNNIYYGAIAGQFAATTEKTSIAANDVFVIEDSAVSNAKKSLKYSTIKTALDALYGFWTAVTHGIKTTSKIGIGTDATSTSQATIAATDLNGLVATITTSDADLIGVSGYMATNGIGVNGFSSAGKGGYFSSVSGLPLWAELYNANTSSELVVASVDRTTSGTASNGIGVLLRFGVENASGTVIYPVHIGARLANATTGAGELTMYCNSALRAKINTDNDFEVSSAGNIIVQSSDAYYFGAKTTDGSWRIIRSGNDLLHQRRESGTWVTKQTITA